MVFKFYSIDAKGLKVKVRKFWGLVPAFGQVTEEKMIEARLFGLMTPITIVLLPSCVESI